MWSLLKASYFKLICLLLHSPSASSKKMAVKNSKSRSKESGHNDEESRENAKDKLTEVDSGDEMASSSETDEGDMEEKEDEDEDKDKGKEDMEGKRYNIIMIPLIFVVKYFIIEFIYALCSYCLSFLQSCTIHTQEGPSALEINSNEISMEGNTTEWNST